MNRAERRRKLREFIRVNRFRHLARKMSWPTKKTSFKQKKSLIRHGTQEVV